MIRMASMFNIYFLKLNRFIYKSKPRLPTCYLLSSKFILTIMISIIIYFLTMDIMLIFKVKHRHNFQLKTATSSFNDLLLSTTQQLNNDINILINQPSQQQQKSIGIFQPLPVKKIMMADATHYIRSPLAEFVESNLKFSEIFPFISANIISLTHCFLSIISTKFLCSDSLFKRQLGVCLFQFRNFLDSFDGVIYRAHAKKTIYKSHYGSLGYYIDAVSDVFGGICLMFAIGYYLFKNPPPNRNRTKCFRLADDLDYYRDTSSSSSSSSPYFYHKLNNSNSNGNLNNNNNMNMNMNSNSNSSINNNINNNSDIESNHENFYASKIVIFISVGLCAIRLAICALFWDRSVHAYEDLLDCASKNQLHQHLQINVLKSNITIFIMLSWRLMNALSLQDYILTAIFIDKIWEFIVKTQYIGWILTFGLIILTELHVSEIRSILLQASQTI